SARVVTSSYFQTIRLPIVNGRDFLGGLPDAPEVIVDQRTARVLWRGANPVGSQIKLGSPGSNAPWVRVVGVVANAERAAPEDRSRANQIKSQRIGDIYYLPGARDTIRVKSAIWIDAI